MSQTRQPFRLNEGTSAKYGCVLRDETDALIPGSALTTLTLTLYDLATGNVINSRTAQDVKGANGGTIDEAGNFAMIFGPLDAAILSNTIQIGAVERHVALFQYTYGSSKAGNHEVLFDIANLYKIP